MECKNIFECSDFKKAVEVAEKYKGKRAVLMGVYIKYEEDDIEFDFDSVGVSAEAVIYLPFTVTRFNADKDEWEDVFNFKLQTIDSGGIWGIEAGIINHGGDEYFDGIEADQIDNLMNYLNVLNVATDLFKDEEERLK